MCSLSIKPSQEDIACHELDCPHISSLSDTNCQNTSPTHVPGHQQYEVTIIQFWSRRGDWAPDCSISANINIGKQACQLHVYPTGSRKEEKPVKQRPEGGEAEVLNVSSENEDPIILEEEIVGIDEENVEIYECDPEAGQISGLTVELVSLTTSNLVIEGDCHVGFVMSSVKSEKLPSNGRIVIIDVGSDEKDKMESIRTGGMGDNPSDDLKIIFDFVALSVSPPNTGADQEVEMKGLLENYKLEISEMNLKVSNIGPMLAELRDQFQTEMESMQDILLETPLSAEVSDLKKDVGQMKAEIDSQMKAELTAQHQSLKESLLPMISNEAATMRREFAALQLDHQAQARDTISQVTALKQDILNSVNSLKDNVQATSSRSSLSAISEVQLQLEMLQDSVLTAVSTSIPPAKQSFPECPYCMEELEPPAKIFQCLSGHLICETCRAKPAITDCPSCHQQFCGRNRGLETFLQKIAGL